MQITGLVFFSDGIDALPGLIPSVALFFIELAWERLGVRGIEGESPFSLVGFWILSGFLPAFIITVSVVSCTC